jgi:hypothetical protein
MLYTETVDIKVSINTLYGQQELLALNLAVHIITTTL